MLLTAEHKQLRSISGNHNYFGYGVHKVRLIVFSLDETTPGKEFIEVMFESEDGKFDESKRLYFNSEKVANLSFNILREIVVLNSPEAVREEAGRAVDNCKDLAALCDLLNKKAVDQMAWISKYPSKTRAMSNGKPAPEVWLQATEPRSRMVADAEDIFGVKAEDNQVDPTDTWGG